MVTLQGLYGYTEGEFSMANAPNQHVFQAVGGNRSTQRKPMQTWGECADSTQIVTSVENRTRVLGTVRQQC